MADPTKTPPSIQYAALPWRRNNAAVEVMLVTSRRSGRWIIPKGWPMKHKPPHAAAAREALEEAGVVGRIGKQPIGMFSYNKLLKRGQVVCQVKVFSLEVIRQKKTWPDKGRRQVRWLSPSDAARTVEEPLLGAIIRGLPKRSANVP